MTTPCAHQNCKNRAIALLCQELSDRQPASITMKNLVDLALAIPGFDAQRFAELVREASK